MQPGVISLEGFLGSDRRDLNTILDEDQGVVMRMKRTHEAIGERMKYFRSKGEAGLGEFISVEPHFDVRVETIRGKMPCPFEHPGIYQKAVTIVKNKKLDKEITFTDLQIHMIRQHGFYEGKGSRYRLDPKEIIEVLEVPEAE
jgi:hypothetical protein